MTETKKPARRQVSRPRWLKALFEVFKEHDLDPASYQPLIDAIKDDIVKQAMS